jgi:DNA primase small subunit
VHDIDDCSQRLLRAALEDIIIEYTYPRLDAEVSKHRNHLLKAPFCIHPKTGRVCVPVDPARIDDFNPEKVPTVAQLLGELDQSMTTDADGESTSGRDWDRTSLKRYVDMLDEHAKLLMNDVRKTKREAGMLISSCIGDVHVILPILVADMSW